MSRRRGASAGCTLQPRDPRVPCGGISSGIRAGWHRMQAMGDRGAGAGVTRGQGIHPPAPGGMERAAVLAPVIAAEAVEGLAHHSDPCQAAPAGPTAVHRASSLWARVGVRGLGGPGDRQGTSAFPPLPVLLGKLRHRQAFPPAWAISGALCTPGLCRWAPRHTQSRDTHGRHTRCTHMHTHPCTHAAPLL